jgi:hypothetical protein
MVKPPKKLYGVELDPAKFGKFEATLKRGLSMPPKPHATPKAKTRPASKGRSQKQDALGLTRPAQSSVQPRPTRRFLRVVVRNTRLLVHAYRALFAAACGARPATPIALGFCRHTATSIQFIGSFD